MRVLLSIALLSAVSLLALRPASALEAGVAACDITPDVQAFRVPMAGYGARQGKPSEGVHDRLHAKVLFLRDGVVSVAIVTTDLRSVTLGLKQQILEKSEGLGITHETLVLSASHTHSGPSIFPEKFWQIQFGAYDPAIVEAMSTSIADALRRAVAAAAPARAGFGAAAVEGFTKNRRWEYDTDARASAAETPALNPALSVVRVDAADGACKALLVHFATHPTLLPASNMLLSADWPGVLQSTLETAFPGAVALYCNGAEGDQAPAGAQGADAYERVADFGGRLAAEAASIARQIETRARLPVGCVRVAPELPAMTFSPGALKGPYASIEGAAKEALPRTAEIQVLRVGDIALAALPGEPICEVGVATQHSVAAAGFKNVLVIGLANDYLGYIVNEKEYAHAGYEVDQRSYYGPGLGDFLASQAGAAAQTLIK